MSALVEEVSPPAAGTGKTSITIEEVTGGGDVSGGSGDRVSAASKSAAQKEETGTFSFKLLDNASLSPAAATAAAFPLMAERETRELFEKWGMAPTNTYLTFRYDEKFAPEKLEAFCRDFFHSADVRAALEMSSVSGGNAAAATPRGMGCCKIVPTNQVRMDFFNRLREEGMVTGETGRIRQCMPEYYDGV